MAEYLDQLEQVERLEQLLRVPRVIRDRSNPFELYDDIGFIYRYRLDKNSVLWLLNHLGNQLDIVPKNISVPPIIQLLVTLQFFGSGSFLRNLGDIFGLHISTVSRIVHRCSRAIASLHRQFICFPVDDDIQKIQQEFYAIAGLPGIVGAIDCTHIPILCPSKDQGELFRNRKGYFSINVQVIGDAKLKINNIVVRWPGSAHDSRIFDNSEICARFERDEIDGVLLGDNGYPLRRYLMTPLLHPITDAERRYNSAHCRSRVRVENLFGVWKRRFPCLSRKLNLKLDSSLATIVSCGVLHNIAKMRNLPDVEADADVPDNVVPVAPPPNPQHGGNAYRAVYIQLYS